jgi:membrane protein YdbS with pleckstrin-like domain
MRIARNNYISVIYGVVVGLLLIEISLVLAAPFAAQSWYPFFTVATSAGYKTIYPGPALIAAMLALGVASAFVVPRRYYGVFVVVLIIAAVVAIAILGSPASCAAGKWWFCSKVQSCGLEVGWLYVKNICVCYSP